MTWRSKSGVRFVLDSREEYWDFAGINSVRLLSHQPEEDAAVRAVTDSGERERTKKLHANPGHVLEKLAVRKLLGKAIRRAHRANGMGT